MGRPTCRIWEIQVDQGTATVRSASCRQECIAPPMPVRLLDGGHRAGNMPIDQVAVPDELPAFSGADGIPCPDYFSVITNDPSQSIGNASFRNCAIRERKVS